MGAVNWTQFFTGGILGGPILNAAGADPLGDFLGVNKKNDANKPAAITLPDPSSAKDEAAATLKRQRQILLATGGQTDYTGGSGMLIGTDIGKTTLLGGM